MSLSLPFVASAAAITAFALLPLEAFAKPKKLFGCTNGQIQSTTCDVGTVITQDGKFYTKILYCDSGGHTLCCVADDHSNIINGTCTTVTLTQNPPGNRFPRPGKVKETATPDPNGRRPLPGLLEPGNGTPGGQGPSPTGTPPARASSPSLR